MSMHPRKRIGQNVLKFSIRKLSIGVTSAVIGSFILSATPLAENVVAFAETKPATRSLTYHYVSENELSEAEKALLQTGLPKDNLQNEQTYYFVYRSDRTLPETGDSNLDALIASLGGIALMAVAVKFIKGNKKVVALVLISAVGQSIVIDAVSAVQPQIFSHLSQTFTLNVGDTLPTPTNIEGYRYVGYIVEQSEGATSPADSATNQENEKVSSSTDEQKLHTSVAEGAEHLVQPQHQPIPLEKGMPPVSEGSKELTSPEGDNTTPTTSGTNDLPETDNESEKPQPPLTSDEGSVTEEKPPVSEGTSNEVNTQPEVPVPSPAEPTPSEEDNATPPVNDLPATDNEGETPQPPATSAEETATEDVPPVSETTSPEADTEPVPPVTPPVADASTEPTPSEEDNVTPPTNDLPATDNEEETPQPPTTSDEGTGTEDVPPVSEATVPEADTEPAPPVTPPVTPPNKEMLDTVLNESVNKASADYSEESWSLFQTALETSAAVQANPTATQEEIDEATTQLTQALANLSVDKATLDTHIKVAQSKVAGDYSPESWEVLTTILQEATGVYSDHSAKQSQVNASMLALADALKQLSVNKQPLEAKIAEREALNPDHYTTASWQHLTEVIANASQVKDAADVKQSELNAEEAKVATALAALQRLRTEPTITVTDTASSNLSKTVTVSHSVNDPDNAYTNAYVNIYKGGVFFRRVPIAKGAPTEITGLEYNTPYELETVMMYDVGNGEQETKLSERQAVELTLKKVTIKDAKAVSLFGLEGNAYRKLLSLAEAPQDLTHYYAVVESDHHKEWRLPVKAITEEVLDGEAVYRVTVAYPELVEDKGTAYESDYNFYVAKHTPQDGLYTSFAALIEAMEANPTGRFTLGANLSAAGMALASTATSYVTNGFSGQLIGENNGKQFAIFDLAAPLFNKMVNATVRNLDLKHVNMATLDHTVGALAKQATGATIHDVAVEGTIVASRTIGGLFGKAEHTKISNVAFTGAIQALSDQEKDSSVGGLVGELYESHLTKGYVDASIRVNATSKQHKAGMIVGKLHGKASIAIVDQVHAKGSLVNKGTSGLVGGLLGSAYVNGLLRDAVSEVRVTNGNTVYGDTAHTGAKVSKGSVFAVEQQTNAVKDQWTTYITPEVAQAKVTAMGITTTLANTGSLVAKTAQPIDYGQVANATEERAIAYYNTLKLLPFYNKEYIVKFGNKIATTDKLYTVPLLSVTPLKDATLVTDLAHDKDKINHIWLHFTDGTIEKRAVSFKENFAATGIAEYQLNDTDMLYTPEWLQSENSQLVDRVVTLLTPIEYESDEVWTALGGTGVRTEQMNGLYLKDSFDTVKEQLSAIVASVLGTSSVNATDEGLLTYVEQNKAQLLLGLSYVNRWYNINFGDTNIKDLTLYRQDFFGRPVDTLRWLVNVGSQGLQGLNPINNHELNPLILGVHHNTASVREYLNAYRNLFAHEQSENEWFKSTTKAYISEGKSMVNEQEVGTSAIYEKLNTVYSKNRRHFDYRNMLLPLLTMSEEGVYIIPTMTTITFGAFDKYIDTSLKATQPDTYAQKVAEFKAVVDREARKQAEHFAAWYRIALPAVRDKLIQGLPVWDSMYNHNNTVWAEKFGDKATLAVREFFGPTGNWHGKLNNSEAYSNGTVVAFVVVGALEQQGGKGSSIFTHEQVHNFDGTVYFGGHGRRPGHSAESFAEGLLQSPRGDGNRIRNSFGLNLIQDGEHPTNFPEYNTTPRRFQNADDLKTYMHGVMDVVYMLDYAEAEAIKALPKEQQRKLLTKLSPQSGVSSNDVANHNDFFREFTEEEWNALNLTGIDDFIDNSVALKRFFREGTQGLRNNEWNAYVKVPLFSPFYSLEENPNGTSGGYTFRRTAFELLAHKGYEQGFIPYVSNQYAKEAETANLPLSDTYIVRKVLGDQYENLNAFKKAMFKERIDKLSTLKALGEIEVQLGLETKRYQLDSFASIQQAITELTQSDATQQTNHVQKLKEAIFNQYLKQTNEFRESIFGNE